MLTSLEEIYIDMSKWSRVVVAEEKRGALFAYIIIESHDVMSDELLPFWVRHLEYVETTICPRNVDLCNVHDAHLQSIRNFWFRHLSLV